MKLTVMSAFDFDNYKDTVRVHRSARNNIRSGKLVRLSVVGGLSTIVAARGLDENYRDIIRIDLENRRRLQVTLDKEYDFIIKTVWPWEAVLWACRASDPALRVATWIAVLSFVLGVIGVAISAIPFVTR